MRVEKRVRARIAEVYGIVSQFGGAIALDSRLGAGTRSQIYFPAPDPAEQLQAGSLARQANDSTKRLTISSADDEGSLRAAIAEYLRGASHRVLESQSAHDALELAKCKAGAIDVLLTDVGMPGLRGTELAHEEHELVGLRDEPGGRSGAEGSGVSAEAISFGVFGGTA